MSNSNDFDQSPLFQLNLMLWLTWPTKYAGIKPIFREQGFSLQAIGQPLSLSFILYSRLTEANIPVQNSAYVDLLLINNSKQVLIPIECKKKSFGPTSSTSKQANCLLCHSGTDIAQVIGLPKARDWYAFLYYVVEDGYQEPMLNTLTQLTANLKQAQIAATSFGSIGIKVVINDGIYLNFVTDGNSNGAAYTPKRGEVKVKDLEPDELPIPLYLLPFDMSSGELDDIAKKALEERIRSALAILIMQGLSKTTFDVTEEEIMSTAIEVWDYWKENHLKSGLLKVVRPYIQSVVKILSVNGIDVSLSNRTIRFSGITPEKAKKIRKYITSKNFKSSKTKIEQGLNAFLIQLELPLDYFEE